MGSKISFLRKKKRGVGASTYFVSLVCHEIFLSRVWRPSANTLQEQSNREPCASLLHTHFQLRVAAYLAFYISHWRSVNSNSWILSCGKSARVFADLSWELSCLIPLTAVVIQQRMGL